MGNVIGLIDRESHELTEMLIYWMENDAILFNSNLIKDLETEMLKEVCRY